MIGIKHLNLLQTLAMEATDKANKHYDKMHAERVYHTPYHYRWDEVMLDTHKKLTEKAELIDDIWQACAKQAGVIRLCSNNMIEIPIEDDE